MQQLIRGPIITKTIDSANMVLGITGHRPSKLGGYNDKTNKSSQIKDVLKKCFLQSKPNCVVSGMALGVDQWAVEIALELGIKVVALIPCLAQDSKWPPSSRTKYIELLDQIQSAGGTIEYVTKEPYSTTCMQLRNQRIVDYSTQMLAIWDRSWGGTGSCVRLAKKASRPVTIIHPTTFEITTE
jgi:uncharacterized phage-like protein YoqJ